MFFIFTSKKTVAGLDKKTVFEIVPMASMAKCSPLGNTGYLDITGLGAAEIRKGVAALKKRFPLWGIIDPKGQCADPASFFFEGASDYLGPKALAGLSKKRLAAAASWRKAGPGNVPAVSAESAKRKTTRLPPGKFEGWKSMRTGTVAPFFFLYVSLTVSLTSGKESLRSRLGEKSFSVVRTRLRDFLQQHFSDAQALLWMETESNVLFLVPPCVREGRAAVIAGLKLILASPLICVEQLGLSVPADFTAALHYGKTPFQAPGKTGTVISDAVNFVFHLGAKYAEPGRFTVSGEVPEEAIPPGIAELLTDAGEYEGFPIRHSRRFSYSRPIGR
jgi:hypothetical protein